MHSLITFRNGVNVMQTELINAETKTGKFVGHFETKTWSLTRNRGGKGNLVENCSAL